MSQNNYFRTFIAQHLTTPKGGLSITNMMKYNQTITTLVLSNLDGDMDWAGFGESLMFNKNVTVFFS